MCAYVRACVCDCVYVLVRACVCACVCIRAETDSNFYYPDILNKTYPDILRIVTSSLAIETFYSLL